MDPACVAFTDGKLAGAVLDRNGLRPARYVMTSDTVVLASEIGVVDLPEAEIVSRGRLTPGRMFLVDIESERIISDTEIKNQLATEHPYEEWVAELFASVSTELPTRVHVTHPQASVRQPPANLRLHRGGAAYPHRRRWPRPGQNRWEPWVRIRPIAALEQTSEAALRLLPSELRSGDESAAGLNPRGHRHQHVLGHRARRKPAAVLTSRTPRIFCSISLSSTTTSSRRSPYIQGHHLGVDDRRPSVIAVRPVFGECRTRGHGKHRLEALCRGSQTRQSRQEQCSSSSAIVTRQLILLRFRRCC